MSEISIFLYFFFKKNRGLLIFNKEHKKKIVEGEVGALAEILWRASYTYRHLKIGFTH